MAATARYIDRVIDPQTGEALRQFGMRLYLEAAGDWLERGAVAAVRRGPKGSGVVVATLHDGRETTVLALNLSADHVKNNDGGCLVPSRARHTFVSRYKMYFYMNSPFGEKKRKIYTRRRRR